MSAECLITRKHTLKILCKSKHFPRRYNRKREWVFVSEHSVVPVFLLLRHVFVNNLKASPLMVSDGVNDTDGKAKANAKDIQHKSKSLCSNKSSKVRLCDLSQIH